MSLLVSGIQGRSRCLSSNLAKSLAPRRGMSTQRAIGRRGPSRQSVVLVYSFKFLADLGLEKPSWLPDFKKLFKGDSASDDYSRDMQKKMGSALKYYHEDGINYHRITDSIIVGSCLQTASDIDTIRDEEGVATVLCLQEDKDMAWWNLDIAPIEERARARSDIRHIRYPIRDFDPFDLRMKLPSAVQTLTQQMAEQPGTAYIHCTAGLGRAPGVALAYMYWMLDMPLEKAYEQLFDCRPCHPQLGAIRSATCDILAGSGSTTQVRLSIPRGTATTVEIAGLDCGWGSRCELSLDEDRDEFVLLRDMPVGKFSYKYIIDGEWTLNPDAPTRDDDGNLNNFVEVIPEDPVELERRARLEMAGSEPTAAERRQIKAVLMGSS